MCIFPGCLIEQLSEEKYECMVCCDVVRCMAPVWSCQSCYHVFHLNCIKKWARSPASQADGTLLAILSRVIPNINVCTVRKQQLYIAYSYFVYSVFQFGSRFFVLQIQGKVGAVQPVRT